MSSSGNSRTVIASDGLRYLSKAAGSQFVGGSFSGTMSCIRCGLHRPRSLLASKRVLGAASMVCAPSCDAVAALLKANNRRV